MNIFKINMSCVSMVLVRHDISPCYCHKAYLQANHINSKVGVNFNGSLQILVNPYINYLYN